MDNNQKIYLAENSRKAYKELAEVIKKNCSLHKEWFSLYDSDFYDFGDDGEGFFEYWLSELDEVIQKYVLQVFMIDKKVEYHSRGTFTSYCFSQNHELTDEEIFYIENFMDYSDVIRSVTYDYKKNAYTDWNTLKNLELKKKNSILENVVSKADSTSIFEKIGCLDDMLINIDLLSMFKRNLMIIFENAYKISELRAYQIDESILGDILDCWQVGIEKVVASKKQNVRNEYEAIKNHCVDKVAFTQIESEINQLQRKCEEGLKKAINLIEYYLVGKVREGDFPFMIYENLPKLFEEFVMEMKKYSSIEISEILEYSKRKVKEVHEGACAYGNHLMHLSNLKVASVRDGIREEEYSKVEGLNFGIISNSLIDQMIYIAQNESKVARLTKKAERDWQTKVYNISERYRRDDENQEREYAREISAPNLINIATYFYASVGNIYKRNLYFKAVYWLRHPQKLEEEKECLTRIDDLSREIEIKEQALKQVSCDKKLIDEKIHEVQNKISGRKEKIDSLEKKWFGKKKARETINNIMIEICALEKDAQQLLSQKENKKKEEQDIIIANNTLKSELVLKRDALEAIHTDIQDILEAYS